MSRHDAKIWQAVAAIPRGRVSTYGAIAALAGMPRGARHVGKALGRAPADLKLPWFRVVAAGGRIALPQGSSARRKQVALLKSEGVGFKGDAAHLRADIRMFGWLPDRRSATDAWLDELLWGPPPPLPATQKRRRKR